jgi:hypothetical protein
MLLKQSISIEVFPYDLGIMPWQESVEACQKLEGDWRLPTRSELNLLFINRDNSFSFTNSYWSSTTGDDETIWVQQFFYGSQMLADKSKLFNIRPVRNKLF